MTPNNVQAILDRLAYGYAIDPNYPPFALTPWEDRNRYREYIRQILLSFSLPEHED